jgi:hypothetical protein
MDIDQPRRPRLRFSPTLKLEQSLSLAAFVMSLTIAAINAAYAMRGAEIAVEQPTQLILYRDGTGDQSVLTAAVRLAMINVADGYGDVVKDARIAIGRGGPSFAYQGTLNTVFVAQGDMRAKECELGMRCLELPGLRVVERFDEILDMPSGAARAFNLSFPAVGWNCEGSGCAGYGSFGAAVRQVASAREARVEIGFHSDGRRLLRCRFDGIDAAYLAKVGWVSVACNNAAG